MTTLSEDGFVKMMEKAGVEVTRENYINLVWGEPLPEWTAELEDELPEELQDWSLFEMVEGEMLMKDRDLPDVDQLAAVTDGDA
jgi:hypothetical protein